VYPYRYDITTIKYRALDLHQEWVTHFYNENKNDAVSIGIDVSGNIYVAGNIEVQMNPILFKIGIMKYNSSGVLQWLKIYSHSQYGESAKRMIVDQSGNTYVTGYTIINPGTLDNDIISISYDQNGKLRWQNFYAGAGQGNDYGNDIGGEDYGNFYQTFGNIYVTGVSVELFNRQSLQSQMTTIKIDNNNGSTLNVVHYFPNDPSLFAYGYGLSVYRRGCSGLFMPC